MTIAKCYRCGGKAQGATFEEASSEINHAVGLSRGIKCGDNYNCVEEQKEAFTKQSPKQTIKSPDIVNSDSPKSGQDTVKTTKSKSKKQ